MTEHKTDKIKIEFERIGATVKLELNGTKSKSMKKALSTTNISVELEKVVKLKERRILSDEESQLAKKKNND